MPSRKTTIGVTLAVMLASLGATDATSLRSNQDVITGHLRNNNNIGGGRSGAATCGLTSKPHIPRWDAQAQVAVSGKQCNDPRNPILIQSGSPNGECECRGTHMAEGVLDCCCTDEDRQLEFKYRETPDKPPTRVEITVHQDEQCERLDCCDSCKCFGDPHCLSFENNNKTPGVAVRETFAVCDIRDLPSETDPFGVQCGSNAGRRIAKSKEHKNRCLGTKTGYEFNKNNCQWVGDQPGYDFATNGGPCQPIDNHPVNSVVMVESGDQQVTLDLGERGVVNNVNLKDSSNNIFTLDSKQSCFVWQCNEGASCTRDMQIASNFQLGDFEFKRNDIITTNDNNDQMVVDVWWDIQNKKDKSTVAVKCYGATQSNDDIGVMANMGLFSTHRQLPNSASKSARKPVQTRLDVGYYESGSSATGGFCKAGEFDEKKALFGTASEDPFLKCASNMELEQGDFDVLEQLPMCQAILEEYSCAAFDETKGHKSKKAKREYAYYLDLMEKCVESMCESFSYSTPNANGFIAPSGTDKYQCKSDVFDFGVKFVQHLYSETFTAEQAECVPEIQVLVDGEQLPMNDQGKVVLLLNEDYDCDTIPRNVVVKQKTCPNTCSGATKLRATVEYKVGYEEFLSLFDTTNGDQVELIVNGEPVDLSRFDGMNDEFCV